MIGVAMMAAFAFVGFLSSVLGVGVRFLVAMGFLGTLSCTPPPSLPSPHTHPSKEFEMTMPLKKSEGLVRARGGGLILMTRRLS